VSLRADVRTACVDLLKGYAASTSPPVKLQVYPGRPKSVNPPCAFVDRVTENVVYSGPTLMARNPTAEIVLLHGVFDSKESVDQADAFVDGFLDYLATRVHQAGANTTIGATTVEDDPVFVDDWVLPREAQKTYFATRISLEGFALD
jgi:hypothetical protein